MYACTYACRYITLCIYIYIYMCVYTYTYTYTYTYIQNHHPLRHLVTKLSTKNIKKCQTPPDHNQAWICRSPATARSKVRPVKRRLKQAQSGSSRWSQRWKVVVIGPGAKKTEGGWRHEGLDETFQWIMSVIFMYMQYIWEVSVTSSEKTDKNTVLGPSFCPSNEGDHMSVTADHYSSSLCPSDISILSGCAIKP